MSRFVGTMAIGTVAALPLLAAGPAFAAPPQIEFSGSSAGLLACNSRPSDRDLTVPAESTVVFVNKLRDGATLRINGRDAAPVPEGGSTEVLFHRGTVRVDMVPDCGLSLSRDIDPVSVTVAAPGGSASRPPSSGPARSGGNSSPTGSSATRSSRPSRTAGADRSAGPDGSASASASGAPAAGAAESPATAGAGDGPSAGVGEGVAAEPVASEASTGKDGPNGLLIIIAVVCVVGVSAGAIRAIAAQRATRTSAA